MQKEYINLGLKNIYSGAYLLAVFHMVAEKGRDILDVASEVAAESSTGSNVRVVDTKFAAGLNAQVYKVDKKRGLVWIAFPWRIFDRGGNVQNILTYIAGNIFGMADVKALKLLDVWFPKEMLKNYDGPSVSMNDVRKYLNVYNRPILGTIIKPKIGLKPEEFANKAYLFWSGGGDFVKHDEPQADQDFCPYMKTVDKIREAMDRAEHETGCTKLHSFNISAADFDTMKKRAEYIIKKMKPGSFCFLIDGITAGWTAVQTARRLWPKVFLHFHRAGHGAMTRSENPIGFTAGVLSKFARLAGASGVHTGTAGIGKMAGTPEEDIFAAHAAYLPKVKSKFFEQDWHGMKGCVSIASGGLNPLKLSAYIRAIGHVDFITTMGGGVHGHPGGTKMGARALVQACEAWQKKVSIEKYAKDHKELAQAIERFGRK
ncbi:ribulose-bisphosphate carboxylase [Candidatus Peregrinibacteria bacterium]|nr:ribulose-bisphosphate carboxylase [Candidatus Peregrinibacteria bacterium]